MRVFGRAAQVLGALPVAVVLRLLRALVKPTRKPERELHKAFFPEAELASCKTLASEQKGSLKTVSRLAHAWANKSFAKDIVGYATRAPDGAKFRLGSSFTSLLLGCNAPRAAEPNGPRRAPRDQHATRRSRGFASSCSALTKAGRDSPPIVVSDINDVALTVAQLDLRVRFAGGARAGPKLIAIIKAHLANRA